MSMQIVWRYFAVGAALLLLSALSLHAQDDTTRHPDSLAARLLGFDGYAVPEPPPIYRPGETAQFWVPKVGSDTPVQVSAGLVAVTPRLYLWVEEGLTIQRGEMQRMAAQLDTLLATLRRRDLFSGLTLFPGVGTFRDPSNVLALPDVDGDPHLYILYTTNLRDNVAALNNPNDGQPAEYVPGGYTNQHEMILLNTTLFADTPLHGGPYINAAARAFYRLLADYNYPGQAAWLKEALAWYTLMALQQQPLSPQEISAYLDAPDTPFDHPSLAVTATSTLAGQQLFLNYTAQRVGGEVFQNLVTQPGEGLTPFDAMLSHFAITDLASGAPVTARDLFADFIIANAINSPIGDGRFVHTLTELDAQQGVAALPLQDQFPADLPQQTVNQFGTRYFWVSSTTARTFGLLFNGQPTAFGLPLPLDSDPNNHFYWSGRGENQDTTLTRGFDLTGVSSATLTFDTWYVLAADWNYGYVEVSTDDGATWTILPTEASSRTNPYGAAYGPGYTGISNLEPPRPFPYLGVILDTNGMTITEIAEGSPLLDTDIQAGDMIIGYDGQEWPGGRPNVVGYLSNFAPGDTVNLYIQRGTERFEAPVVLGTHPTRVFTPDPLWITQQADLSAFAGQRILVRFEYVSLPDRENYGIAVDNIAVPELGFLDDAEQGVPGWTLNGWEQRDNQVPQRFLVQVATPPTQSGAGSVRRLIGPSDTATNGAWTFNINPGEGMLVAISGLSDDTDAAAVFDLYLRDLTPQPETTPAPEATDIPAA